MSLILGARSASTVFPESTLPFSQKKVRSSRRFESTLPRVFDDLPMKLILGYLPRLPTQIFLLSSKEIKSRIIEVENKVHLAEVEKFIDLIIIRLWLESKQLEEKRPEGYVEELIRIVSVIKNLVMIPPTLNPSTLLSLARLKNHQLRIKERLIVVLSRLKIEKLDTFQGLIPPIFFEHVFEIAKVSNRISVVNSMPDTYLRKLELIRYAFQLVSLKALDRAIPIALSTHGYLNSSRLFCEISKQLADVKKYKEARKIISKIGLRKEKETALKYIATSLRNALALAKAKTDGSSVTTQTFSADELASMKEALTVAKIFMILPTSLSRLKKYSLSERVVRGATALLDKANAVKSVFGRDQILCAVSVVLSGVKKVGEAVSVAHTIKTGPTRAVAFRAIEEALARMRTA